MCNTIVRFCRGGIFCAFLCVLALMTEGLSAEVYTRKDGSKVTLVNTCKGVLGSIRNVSALADEFDKIENAAKEISVTLSLDNKITFTIYTEDTGISDSLYSNEYHFLHNWLPKEYFRTIYLWFLDEAENKGYFNDISDDMFLFIFNYKTKNGAVQFQGLYRPHYFNGITMNILTVPVFFVDCVQYRGKGYFDLTGGQPAYFGEVPHYNKLKNSWNVAYLVAYIFSDILQIKDIPVPPGLDDSFLQKYKEFATSINSGDLSKIIAAMSDAGLRWQSLSDSEKQSILNLFAPLINKHEVAKITDYTRKFGIKISEFLKADQDKIFVDIVANGCKEDDLKLFSADYKPSDKAKSLLIELPNIYNSDVQDLLVKHNILTKKELVALSLYNTIKDNHYSDVQEILKKANPASKENLNLQEFAFVRIPGTYFSVSDLLRNIDSNDFFAYIAPTMLSNFDLATVVFHPAKLGDCKVAFFFNEKSTLYNESSETIYFDPIRKKIDFAKYGYLVYISAAVAGKLSVPSFKKEMEHVNGALKEIYQKYQDGVFECIYNLIENRGDASYVADAISGKASIKGGETDFYSLPVMLNKKDIDFDTTVADSQGNTLLIKAAKDEDVNIAKYLLKKGVDPTAKNNDGKNAYSFAIERGNKKLIGLLKKYQ